MSLRFKTASILLLIVAAYVSLSFVLQRGVLLPGFRALERQEGMEDATRAVAALQREIHYLDSFCLDWSGWDDTYAYVEDRNKEYEDANFTDETYTDNKLNFLFVLDSTGRVVYGRVCELGAEKESVHDIALPDLPMESWPASHPLLQHTDISDAVSGVMRTGHGPALVVSRPITTSEDRGPIRGTLIMGRFCDDKTAKILSDATLVPVRVEVLPEKPVPGMAVQRADSPLAYTFEEVSPRTLRVSTIVPDITGKPLLRLHVDTLRDIMQKGQNVMHLTLWAMAGTGVAVLIAMLIFLQRAMLGPLLGLTDHVARIAKEEDLALIDMPPRHDETGMLASEFNRMVRRIQDDRAERQRTEADLREMRERVLRAEHLATLGEMGASVAHEIRNPLAGISGALQVLRNEFTEGDSRRPIMDEALAQVRRVDLIVNRLLMFAKSCNPVKAPCDLRAVAAKISEEAARTNPSAAIRFTADGSGPVTANVDAALIEQVMQNLVSNAMDAINATAPSAPEIRWTFAQTGGATSAVLHDNGGGVPKEAQPHLFRPFFTTKTYGTGLGLAICRRIVEAHGGTIDIASIPGEGTVVTLSFPKET